MKDVLGEPKMVKGHEHVFICPDPYGRHGGRQKLKLSVNVTTDRFNCWSCGFAGQSLVGILRLKPHNPAIAEYLDGRPPDPIVEPDYEKLELPLGFRQLVECDRAGLHVDLHATKCVSYLKSRGIGYDSAVRHRIGFTDGGRYFGRVVVPSYDATGELNFFTARAMYKDMSPRYDNPRVSRDIIFNEVSVDWSRPVILVEGVFDALTVGDDAIPLLTKTLSTRSKLFQRLVEVGQTVYVALDSTATEEAMRLANDLASYRVDARLVRLKAKDPSEMGRQMFRELLLDAERVIPRQDPRIA